ncbi:succinate dehydrogenase cytochrome b subunit [Tessaracoccus sp. MC1756]|uniref:succinate dehydrogenase cytochrome b subunit n=1 Tax=Tessaracoccus sp. MC1756 TaxID=2760311 RepID=UPI00351C2780
MKKVIMAVTGLIMIAFLLVHMYGNLKMFYTADNFHAFDYYAEWLKGKTPDGGILYPIMPAGTFIWVFRFALVLSVVLHIWSAAALSAKTLAQRGDKYVTSKKKVQTYSSRTMRWGGVIIAAFLIFHLLQFTIVPGSLGAGGSGEHPHEMVLASFSLWWMVVIYGICMVLIVMHIRHGFWSAFATLGGNPSAKSRQWLNILSVIVAAVLFIGFMVMPIAVLMGVIS